MDLHLRGSSPGGSCTGDQRGTGHSSPASDGGQGPVQEGQGESSSQGGTAGPLTMAEEESCHWAAGVPKAPPRGGGQSPS